MKRNLPFLVAVFTFMFSASVMAQLSITEIMYNPPESGTDSLEFVEIYNAGDPVDLENYQIDGFGVTFPAMTIGTGEYIVAAGNPEAFESIFNLVPVPAEGGLKNGGEKLSILDADGTELMSVEYGDKDPWTSEPDGGGSSLELCDGKDASLPESWIASTSATGIIINGNELKCTPGKANSQCDVIVADATIVASNYKFEPADVTINLGETVLFKNEEGNHNANGSQDVFPDNPESFTSGDPSTDKWEYTHTFNTAGVYKYQCDLHAGSMNGTITVVEPTDDFPFRLIGDVTTTNEDGVADSLDVKCTLGGVVHGINYRPGGLQFVLIDDNNNGISAFSGSDAFGYEFNEGDVVKVTGTIGQYNGLTQIYLQSVSKITDGALQTPTVVTELNENTESQLVTIENVSLVDASQWSNSGSGFNVEMTDGTNTFSVRIDKDTDIYDKEAPTGTFNVTGLGSQFDNESPYLQGYQLLPRYVSDIDPYETGNTGGDEYPDRSIGSVTMVNGEGVADSLDVKCKLTGTVYGINFRPNGLQFTLIDDNNDGIGVFSASEQYDYTVTEGDLISIEGTISQYNGLTQIQPVSLSYIEPTIISAPTSITSLGEETESQLVKFADVMSIVDPTEWKGDGTSFNVNVTDGTNTFVMRIDSDTDLASTSLESNQIELTGIGGQYDNEAPYLQGYQIFPRYKSDVKFVVSTSNEQLFELNVYPNPASAYIKIECEEFIQAELISIDGKVSISSNEPMMNINNQVSGVYLLRVTSKQGLQTSKVVIR